MHIAWLANTFKPIGGAEITDGIMLEYGEKKNQIKRITPKDKIPDNADLYILSNISKFKDNEILKIIESTKPFINYFHDYDLTLKDHHVLLLQKAKLNIFLSPLHRNAFRMYANGTIPKSLCIPSPFNNKQFYDMKKPREKDFLYVGHCLPHKGVVALEQWLDEDETRILHHYGNGKINHTRAINHESISYEKLNEVYNQFESFVFYPQWDEPFGRIIAEAYFSGCKIIANRNKIGFYSYNYDYSNKKAIAKELQNAPKKFWLAISNYKLYGIVKAVRGFLK